ncbi:MAG: 30S ribosomal protein S7 [Candidatus Margulisbacteria bacterium]|nr:30S ribosomal protein S7 [Candidatus Margulisiibacteriota bacterium]
MSRRAKEYRKRQSPDSVHGSLVLSKFINKVMMSGKKSIARDIVYRALEILSQKVNAPAVDAFEKALRNAIPLMEVRSRRVGGSTYQVPMEVRAERGVSLAMRWLINNSRTRSGHSMIEKMSAELIDAYNGVGASIKKREETHRMAESNKAFAHFRW